MDSFFPLFRGHLVSNRINSSEKLFSISDLIKKNTLIDRELFIRTLTHVDYYFLSIFISNEAFQVNNSSRIIDEYFIIQFRP